MLLLLLGITACDLPTAPHTSTSPSCDPNGGGESIFGYVPPCDNGPGGQQPPSSPISLTNVAVSPAQVRAGDPFTVSAMAVFSCHGAAGAFSVSYGTFLSPVVPTDPKGAD